MFFISLVTALFFAWIGSMFWGISLLLPGEDGFREGLFYISGICWAIAMMLILPKL